MLRDDDVMTAVHEQHDDRDDVEIVGTITTPNPIHEGIADVLSLRALVRAVAALHRPVKSDGEFERALVKVINLNGSVARAIEDGRR